LNATSMAQPARQNNMLILIIVTEMGPRLVDKKTGVSWDSARLGR
jgi:hypothetical protein